MIKLDPIEINPDTFLKEHCTLPPLPEVILNIQQMINSAGANVENISKLIANDPGLTSQILKIVNSAYYGFRKEISDIKFAVAYLGFSEIYNIVLSLSVVETLDIEEVKELDNFWTHSIFCARCAKFLAKKFEPLLNPENIWLGAILHDIGKLVYFKFYPQHFKVISALAKAECSLYSEVEKRFDIPSSSYIGQLLCKRWNLPDIINDACEFHTLGDLYDAEMMQKNDFKKIICCANLISILTTYPLTDETKQEIFDAIIQLFNINKKELLTIMGEIYTLKQE